MRPGTRMVSPSVDASTWVVVIRRGSTASMEAALGIDRAASSSPAASTNAPSANFTRRSYMWSRSKLASYDTRRHSDVLLNPE
jgi:hypothetical protein